jgi:nitrogen fixation/metabolism regulation signal transduction histidine kinase
MFKFRLLHGVSTCSVLQGIAPADLERSFEAFFTTRAAGLGVGLAIRRSIVEAHGGRLWAESAPGRGAPLRGAPPAWPGLAARGA